MTCPSCGKRMRGAVGRCSKCQADNRRWTTLAKREKKLAEKRARKAER